MTELLSKNIDEIKEILSGMGQKPFAAKQLMEWLNKGVAFAEMNNLSKELRINLAQNFSEGYAEVVKKLESSDGTIKYLMRMSGGGLVECVVMRYKHGNTLCVSTQIGCRMGCIFCASGKDGLLRNLTASEILSQFIEANRQDKISNVVLMGSGEPLDNYDNVIEFIRALNTRMDIGMRHISLSTCGIVDGIKKLADEEMQINLSLSLHSAVDEKRKTIMPTAKVYSVSRIIDAAKYYFKKTGRRIIIEYTLINGFNDAQEDIDALLEATKGLACHVNVIPLNEAGRGLNQPTMRQAYAFAAELEKNGRSATVRRSLGSDIEGACGQLKRRCEG